MAYRRSIIARAKSFYQHQPRFAPSLSHITASRDREEFSTQTISVNSDICSRFLGNRNSPLLSANVSRLIRSRIPASYGLIIRRNFSNVPLENKDLNLNGVVGVVGDKVVEDAAVVNEVAAAAADSFPPVAAFQHLIDYVHCYTGFEWWASIAATTLLIRFIYLPVSIYFLNLSWLFTIEVNRRKPFKWSPEIMDEIIAAMKTKITYKYDQIYRAGMVIGDVYPCILFFAIQNMAEKVPSFMTGGTLWFTDLTTPCHSMVLPVLLASTFWLRIGLLRRVYLRSPTFSDTNVTCIAMLVAVASSRLPSAIHCYLITSNLFSIVFSIVMMDPRAQKMLSLKPPTGFCKW